MCEFEEYLTQLHALLSVDPRRAQDIREEVRGHLEIQAAEFERQGLGRDEAAASAMQVFGEPEAVASLLTDANSRNQRVQALKAFGVGAVIGACIWPLGMLVMHLLLPRYYAPDLSDMDAVVGSTLGAGFFGGLGAVAIGPGRVRLRLCLVPLLGAPVLLLGLRASARLFPSVFGDIPLPAVWMVSSITLTLAAIALAIAWVVHRWELDTPMPLPAPSTQSPN